MVEAGAAGLRMRKEPLKTMKMEDIKIEFVDVCVVPTTEAYNIFDFDSDSGSPSTPSMEVGGGVGGESSPEDSASSSGGEQSNKPRKRAKLDHMSPEEKAQHRKMMNRISAQSARDRQKALMIRQDSTIKTLQTSHDDLKKKNQDLMATNEDLLRENDTLKEENKRLSSLVMEIEAKLKVVHAASSASLEVELESDQGIKLKEENEDVGLCCGSPSEPAVLRTIPLQKGSTEPLQKLSLILLLWMSYLGGISNNNILNPSYKSWENFQKVFATPGNSSCQTLINSITPLQKQLLHKWLIRQGLPPPMGGQPQWTPG